jgi:hypothetical protein
MRQEVIAYYKRKKLEIPKLIERRPLGITAGQVEAACAELFDDILIEKVKLGDRQIAREVFNRARKLNGQAYEDDWKLIREYRDNMNALEKQYARLQVLSFAFIIIVLIEQINRLFQ